MAGYTRRYRFFGIELRIFLWLIALLLLVTAAVGLKNSIWLSMLVFLIFVLLVFFIRLDSAYHLVIITPGTWIFENIVWRRLTTSFVHIPWSDVEKVTTFPWGPLNVMKSTRIESRGRRPVQVFSFMEDYLHFLKDLTNQAKSAEVDKLTSDLPAGRADL
ncbi:MAG: hypothetical protein JSV10_02950 [Candidatus Zixiibacteriota bacterium]|nr:MAG: hypothetical protein JSV10_02950 [candidate division Zixibacteria bacterium]